MPQLKGSKTEANLKEAFAGESQANRRYLYFAQKADIEGYPDVAALFRSVAEGETGHAFGHFDFLAEVEQLHLAELRQLVERLVHRLAGDHRHLRRDDLVHGLDGGVRHVAVQGAEDGFALWRDLAALRPEQGAQLARRSHVGKGTTSCT